MRLPGVRGAGRAGVVRAEFHVCRGGRAARGAREGPRMRPLRAEALPRARGEAEARASARADGQPRGRWRAGGAAAPWRRADDSGGGARGRERCRRGSCTLGAGRSGGWRGGRRDGCRRRRCRCVRECGVVEGARDDTDAGGRHRGLLPGHVPMTDTGAVAARAMRLITQRTQKY